MKDRISAMVDRFLGWKLPKTFGPDAGISFNPTPPQKDGTHPWPTGTNLLTADEARAMFEHALADETSTLAWLFANCRIVYHPPGGEYPIEHNPHALGYDKDGSNFLAFTARHRTAGVLGGQASGSEVKP